ncbi:TPA: hypothetical protein DDW35_02475 [Candidatus Sumerlaeota bacterium]|jgi:hypothetical protein|nr:hypothetical protein [Candidatus Sumerlaeota bacterium]
MRSFAYALLINSVLFTLFFITFNSHYELIDDLFMQLIAQGFYTGEPSEYLVYTHFLIGLMLRWLYSISVQYNWYFLYLMAVQFTSLTALLTLFQRGRNKKALLVLYCVFFLFAQLHMLQNPQFTTIAFLAGVAGLFLLLEGLCATPSVHKFKILMGFLFIALMIMVRKDVFFALGLFAIPFLVERMQKNNLRRFIGGALACILLYAALWGSNQCYYKRTSEWANFLEYNTMYGKIETTRLKYYAIQAAPSVGWSATDALMFVEFYFPEPEVYLPLSKIRIFMETAQKNAAATPLSLPSAFVSYFSATWLDVGGATGALTIFAILVSVACVLVSGHHRRRLAITLCVLFVYLCLVGFLVYLHAHFPPRLSYCMPLFIILVCLYWTGEFVWGAGGTEKIYQRFIKWGALTIIGALCVSPMFLMAKRFLRVNAGYRDDLVGVHKTIADPIKKLLPGGEKPVIVLFPNGSNLERSLFFCKGNDAPFYCVPWSWLAHSPIFQKVLEQHHLLPFSRSLVDRPDVFLLMADNWIERVKTFYLEHYGMHVRFDRVLNATALKESGRKNGHSLYQLHLEKNEQ